MTTEDNKDQTPGSNDEMIFVEESAAAETEDHSTPHWRVLIVDDDEVVHSSTCYAFNNVNVFGRKIEFLHAYSAAEARVILGSVKDLAIILLDVVMESEDAGLKLVKEIRDDFHLHDVRIILRTGQPGYAPEIETIRDLDINDYKTKSELTRAKLYATLTTSVRSYDQLRKLNASRHGLDMIVRGSAELIRIHGLKEFAGGVITQLAALLGLEAEGLVCAQETVDDEGNPVYLVIAAAGRYLEFINQPVNSIVDEHLRTSLVRALQKQEGYINTNHTTLYVRGASGRDISVYIDTPIVPNAIDRKMIEVFCSNISVCLDNIALVSRLRNQAYFDQMLLLPNRMHFFEEIDGWVNSHNDADRVAAIIDIDHFAEINDSFGYPYGDLVLKSISLRLRGAFGENAMLARVGGDVFGVFGNADVVNPAFIQGLFRIPFPVDGESHTISATIGLAKLSDIDGGGSDAFKAASIALKRAQSSERGRFAYFTREMGIETRARVKLLHELRGAFECDRLFLNYQPQVSLTDGSLVGLEALIRWRTDEGTFVPPDDFIPLAENSGLIISIGEWVLRAACLQAKRLHDRGLKNLRMAINVSLVQFRDQDFLAALDLALSETGVNPELIELEITESVAMLEADTMIDMFNKIKERGVQIAVDDFGTGFSSLSYLQRLKIDRLKIDRAFIFQMVESNNEKCIADMVIELGNSLGLCIIAEGVENEWQAVHLRSKGCQEAQGFLYAHPMDEKTLADWLKPHLN